MLFTFIAAKSVDVRFYLRPLMHLPGAFACFPQPGAYAHMHNRRTVWDVQSKQLLSQLDRETSAFITEDYGLTKLVKQRIC